MHMGLQLMVSILDSRGETGDGTVACVRTLEWSGTANSSNSHATGPFESRFFEDAP